MRAREFMVERKFRDRKAAPISTMYHYPSMPGDSVYKIYRLGLAMANPDMEEAEGPAAADAVVVAYTPQDEEIILRASKMTGHTPSLLTSKGSTEPKSTGTVSPVANWQKSPQNKKSK